MLDLQRYFYLGDTPSLLVFGEHNAALVLLSVLIAIFTSTMALQLAGVARMSRNRFYRQLAIGTGAVALGGGVWSMHFIGMLSFQLCAAVRYDPLITLLSGLPSLFASWIALNLLAQRNVSQLQFIGGGVLVGAGIGAMHYSGMAAMQMAPLLRYDPWMFVLSIIVAVVLAVIALWVRFGLRGRMRPSLAILVSGAVMGLAIAGMHYTGMAAARFVGMEEFGAPQGVQGSFYLAMAVSMATISLSICVAAVNGLLRYRQLFQELERRRKHLDSLLDAAVEAILTVDHSGVIRSVNHAVLRLFGWHPHELIGQPMQVLMNPAYGYQFQMALESYKRSGQRQFTSSEIELEGLTRDGREFPVRVSLGVTDHHGKPWFVAFVADISERREMEQALRTREEQYRSLIRNMPGIAFRVLPDDAWNVLFVSDAVEAVTGWSANDFSSGRITFGQLYHPDDQAAVNAEVRRAIAERRSYVVEYRLFDRSGTERWIWEGGSACYDEAGNPQWIDGVLLDHTESKLLSNEYEGKFTAIGRAMALIEFDLDGHVLAANEHFLQLFGYREAEVLGQHHSLFCPSGYASSAEYQAFWQELRKGEFSAGEYRRLAKDGREVWIHATYNPILDFDGKPVKVVKLATDLTPRRVMEQELRSARDRAEQAAAARSSFLANMSHEIRTPMNAIMGFTELLLDSPLEQNQRRHLNTVQAASRSLLGLLNDILDTAKLDRGAIELEAIDFSLAELCEQVCAALRLSAERKGLDLRIDYGQRVGEYFCGDPLRLQQVLTNLLGNAVKFTERGEVRLVISGEPGALRLAIRDTGIGIAADRLERIFDPFAQADASMSRRFGGTGLGTTISRQLVELMGGRLGVESEVGRGSVFTVDLPLPAGRSVQPATRSHAPSLPALRILVADDVPQNVELLELNLRRLGHQPHSVGDGQAAVDAYSAQAFDLILMDVQMPGMDGLEATRRIRAIEQQRGTAAVPIIALTASVLDRDRQNALDAGMNGFASKPLELNGLLDEIARLLGTAPVVLGEKNAAPAALATLDWTVGARLWGGPLPMARAVVRFLDEQEGSLVSLEQAVDSGDRVAITALAHRLRGAAANLALPRLAGAIGALEGAADHGTAEQLGSALDRARAEFVIVRQSVPLVPAAVDGALDEVLAQTAVDDLREALQALELALSRGGLDDAALERLRAGTARGEYHETFASLNLAIDDFDFDQALHWVRTLGNRLEQA
ncbi:PAS domain S-box-containing protein [Pseudomonas nitritireducens]|uniref:Sensory/regulatory protein RpfC n=1 Tax=Pseudomonas nitroreducens TaxID=46680 RepID=A0A7W7KRP4_PSENT|nr:PAS domain S-box protein [Pseudomonas nitritireducens]MBB4867702.1 PAS domain S-box-containing protein [Pseudomonas nitritireducens]